MNARQRRRQLRRGFNRSLIYAREDLFFASLQPRRGFALGDAPTAWCQRVFALPAVAGMMRHVDSLYVTRAPQLGKYLWAQATVRRRVGVIRYQPITTVPLLLHELAHIAAPQGDHDGRWIDAFASLTDIVYGTPHGAELRQWLLRPARAVQKWRIF